MWEEALHTLKGMDFYYDTSRAIPEHPERWDLFGDMIRTFGPDRILFGTDSPWWTPGEAVGMLESLGLPEEDVEKIKWKNALRLFWGE